MRSVMSHAFSMIPSANIARSVFNRSHGYKTTFDAGYLIPFYADEALPGDTFTLNTTLFARLATPVVPVMDNMHLETFYFAVPIRLLWSNWEKFCGEQTDPGDSIDFTIPQVVSPAVTGWTTGSVYDYLGIPIGVASLSISALFTRAYNLIWNEWFRDENLQDSAVVDIDNGPDTESDYVLLRRGKRHDYFTSALPWPQKQSTGMEIPLGTTAPVYGDGKTLGLWDGTNTTGAAVGGSGSYMEQHTPLYNTNVGTAVSGVGLGSSKSIGVVTSGTSGLVADLTNASAATINSLREAFQIQKLLERDARGGTRYTEIIRSHFGVVSPDARLQRPEYLGGSSSRVHVTPVQQTSSTDATTPQGNLAAFGLAADTHHGFSRSFTEHCVLLGLVSVRADLTYQQGLPRMFSRSTRYDYYWPSLANLGEQSILNKEIYCDGTANDDLVFGYQERWAEYRYFPSQITGVFRSAAASTLDVWHLSQDFGSLPTLNATFIVEDPPIDRVIATPTEPHFLFDSFMDLKCARPMPVYSVPGLLDHF